VKRMVKTHHADKSAKNAAGETVMDLVPDIKSKVWEGILVPVCIHFRG
jgi:hypothetical protein